MKQEQFLNLASAEEALKKFRDAVNPAPLGEEQILLKEARGRVLSRDVIASINVPFYDRSNLTATRLVRKIPSAPRKMSL